MPVPGSRPVLKKGFLMKLSAPLQWNMMEVTLTVSGIFLSQPGDDLVKYFIPLNEISRIRKVQTREDAWSIEEMKKPKSNMIRIHTDKNGCNYGKIFHLNAETEEDCISWIQIICSSIGEKIILDNADQGVLKKVKNHFKQYCYIIALLSLSVMYSFCANNLQTEALDELHLTTSEGPLFNKVAKHIEICFTIVLAGELIANVMAEFLRPFFMVRII